MHFIFSFYEAGMICLLPCTLLDVEVQLGWWKSTSILNLYGLQSILIFQLHARSRESYKFWNPENLIWINSKLSQGVVAWAMVVVRVLLIGVSFIFLSRIKVTLFGFKFYYEAQYFRWVSAKELLCESIGWVFHYYVKSLLCEKGFQFTELVTRSLRMKGNGCSLSV